MANYWIESRVTSTGITLKEHESMYVLSLGRASNTTVNNGGRMQVSSGGTANSTTVNNGGWMQVLSRGRASNTTVNSDGLMRIESGGIATTTTVNPGGSMYLLPGGWANSTTVNSGGQIQIEAGGTANNTEINSDGKFYVGNGVTASNATVHNGGNLYVSDGGKLTGRVKIEAGGVVTAELNAILDFAINGYSLSSDGVSALILNDFSLIQGSPTFTLTVGGNDPGIYRLAGNAAGFNDKTITVKNTSGDEFGTFKVGGEKIVGDKKYTLSINSASELIVTVTNLYDLTGYLEGKADLTTGMIASGVLIHSGGILNVLNGGYASMTRITNGSMHVSDGGFASMTSVDGGSMHVSSGGTADGVTVLHLGKLHVSAGGNVNTTTVSITGSMYVSDGGAASNTTVSSGGSMMVYDGGKASNTTVSSGGSMTVYDGGKADNTTIYADGRINVSSGGAASNTTVSSGGGINVSSGGAASNTTVSSGGSFYVSEGGAANNTTVYADGRINVSSGGAASNTTVSSGGSFYVSEGGKASNTTVHANGSMTISSGGTATGKMSFEDNAIISAYEGGILDFDISGVSPENDPFVNHLSLVQGDPTYRLTLSWFSAAGDYKLAEGADGFNKTITVVNTLGETLGTLTVDGGTQTLGGRDYTLTLNGGALGVTLGEYTPPVDLTGALYTPADLTAGMYGSSVVIGKGGSLTVFENGLARRTTVNSGGKFYVSGGSATETTVSHYGYMYVSSGASADDTEVYGYWGAMVILPSGAATNIMIHSAGQVIVHKGASVDGVTANGFLVVSSGGTATNVRENGGAVRVEDGASVTFIPNAFSGIQVNQADCAVHSGTTGTDIVINQYGSMFVCAGGIVNIATVNSDGNIYVSSGGSMNSATVDEGYMDVFSGGTADVVTVHREGYLTVSAGGTATNVRENGGWVEVDPDATVTFVPNVLSGLVFDRSRDRATIHSGTTGIDLTFNKGNGLALFSGGFVKNITVGYYVGLDVYSGAKVTGKMTFDAGALVSAYEGGILDFDLRETTAGADALLNNMAVVTGDPTFTLTVAGTEAAGNYKLAENAAGFNKTITVVNTSGTELGTLTVGGGTQTLGGRDYTLTLTDGGALGVTLAGDAAPAVDLTGDLNSSFTLSVGKVASSVNILDKGKLDVRNGGIAEVTTVNSSGELHVSSGGSADGVTVSSGGSLGVYIGGSATGIVAEEGAYYCFMAAPNTYIKGTYAGSAFEIAGTARGFAIQSGCELYVWFGGSASNTTVTNGGNLCIDEKGSATGVTVTSGGSAMVLYGASATGIVAEDGAHLTMMVASDTYAQGTYAGSAFEINDTVSGYTLHGLLAVTFGGTVDDVTVNPGCELIVHADGTATNIKENGGFVEFEEGATVSFVSNTFSGVHVSGANSASVHSGTTAADTTVSDGGNLFVVGGVADGITVANDGVLYLYGGKVTGKMTFGTYAQVFAYTGAILDFDLTQTTAGADALVNDLAPALATDFDYMLTVSGSEAAGNYKLAGNAAGFDKTITVVNTSGTTLGTLTVGGDTLFTKSSGYTLTLGADNTLSVDITTKSVSVDDTTPPVISNVAANITTMTLGSVTVTADFDDDVALASKQYRIGAGDWQDYTTGVTVTTNTTVYFKAVDTAGNETTASYVVTNIIPPVAPDLSGDLTASYDLTAGMVGHDVNILNGGELNVSDGGTVENTTVNNGGELNVSSGGKLTGKMTFENGATVTAETGAVFDFDLTQTTPGADALVNDLSFVKDQPFKYTLTVDNSMDLGTYKLAGGAEGFNKPITLKSVYGETGGTFTVDDGMTKIGDAYITLAVIGSDLFFRVSDKGDAIVPDNKPDDGKNDYLWTKKLGWNDANILVTNTIRGNGEIDIDALGTIDTDDGYHNMFGNDGTNKDTGDVAKIGVKTAAKLTFTIDSNAAGTFYVYEDGFDKKGKRNQITVGKVSVKAGQTAMLKDVCLTATGNYYVAMTAQNVKKAGAEGLYNVNVTESKFFRDADDGSNNTAKDNYLTWAERGVKSIDLENELMTDSAVFNNFVGFADNADYIKLVLPKSAYMKFSLTGEGDGTAKFTIWKQDNATGKMSKVTNVSLPAKKAYDATTKAQFLDVNGGRYEYYISMECSDAAKGKGVYYNVQIADDTVFFDSADDGRNDVLYDKKAKAFYAEDGEHHFETTNVGGGTKTVKLDSDPVGDTDYENFVGYGDAADYAKIKLTTSGDLYFKLRASGNATFTIYEKSQDKKGNDTLKAIQTTKLTLAKGKTTVEATTDLIADLAAGEYYVSMTAKSTKANASGSVFYNVTANLNPSVADALEMPMAAAAYADSMQDKLFGESGNGLLASL